MTGEATTTENPPAEKPTLWQRTKTNVKNFFSHALGYIPRGIILTGMLFAGSALIETTTTFSALGVTGINGGALAAKFGMHLALGSLISGVLGATMAPCKPCASQGHGVQPGGNPMLSENEVALGQKIAQEVTTHATDMAKTGVMEAAAPGSGLPAYAVGKLLGTKQPSL
ncbi:MAG: hypothetical protein SFX19_05590 [Alphaproteobacteria bacterium]|nr:hypothetical protein [Alphaproteobacteria bacterium]